MTAADPPVIAVDELRMQYGSRHVLDGVTFEAGRGEVLCLLGPNGAGKTTTIEVLEGLRAPSKGLVRVLGSDPWAADERWRARIGIVLQSWRDHGRWRVRELLAHLGSYYVRYAADAGRRPWDPDELVAAAGLGEQADQEVRTLSGGQRRRLDVAVGIVGRPEVLFLDEPTAGFDPEARRGFHALVRAIALRDRTTVLLTTHDLAEADLLADRIAILAGGRIVAAGTRAELAARIVGSDEVRWARGGVRFREATPDATRFAFDLFRRHGDAITELEVRRASLEDTYLAIVHGAEAPGARDLGVTPEGAR
jgi:ABC-2 type transport system ATP-binding protein